MATHFAKRLGTTGGWLVGGLALVFGWLMLDAPCSHAQDGQPPRARMLLKSARELYARGEYEAADGYYRQALLSRDSLTPSEQHDLDAQLQPRRGRRIRKSRQAGLLLIQQAQGAILQGKADEAESYMRLADSNQVLAPVAEQATARRHAAVAESAPGHARRRRRQVAPRSALANRWPRATTTPPRCSLARPTSSPPSSRRWPSGRILREPSSATSVRRPPRAKMPPASAPTAITTNYSPDTCQASPGRRRPWPGQVPGQGRGSSARPRRLQGSRRGRPRHRPPARRTGPRHERRLRAVGAESR